MVGITSFERSSGQRVAPYHAVGGIYYIDVGVGMIKADVNMFLHSQEAAILAPNETITYLPPFFMVASEELRLLNNIYYYVFSK